MDTARRLLEAGLTDRYVEGAVAAELITNAQPEADKLAIMKYLIQNYGLLETTGVPVPLTGREMLSERWKELRKVEGKLIDAQIERTFIGFPTADEAAQRLLIVFSSQPNNEMRDFFIANLLADSRVPYLDIPGTHDMVTMSNEQYRTIQKKLAHEIRRIVFIIKSAGVEQRTQRASLLLSVLDSVSDRSEKVVLMANIISVPEMEMERIIKRVAERE
ncbi:MAG: hypothetical protein NTW96_06715 [Planctomycetia bacterium]|nr:hypothetical protein [Planctomycetia bacterium]